MDFKSSSESISHRVSDRSFHNCCCYFICSYYSPRLFPHCPSGLFRSACLSDGYLWKNNLVIRRWLYTSQIIWVGTSATIITFPSFPTNLDEICYWQFHSIFTLHRPKFFEKFMDFSHFRLQQTSFKPYTPPFLLEPPTDCPWLHHQAKWQLY